MRTFCAVSFSGLVLGVALCAALLLPSTAYSQSSSNHLIKQTLCDIEVMYLFDRPETIDWPTLFYLNDEFGARIELVTIVPGSGFRRLLRESPEYGLTLNEFQVDTAISAYVDSLLALQFESRRPDVLLLGNLGSNTFSRTVASRISDLPVDDDALFDIRKIYRIGGSHADFLGLNSIVTVSSYEMYRRYSRQMEEVIPDLYPTLLQHEIPAGQLMRYVLVRTSQPDGRPDPGFFVGLQKLRLRGIIENNLSDGALKQSFLKRTGNFISLFNSAGRGTGVRRVDNLIAGYKELITFKEQAGDIGPLAELTGFSTYLARLVERGQKAVLDQIGVEWRGKVFLHDTPHGPKLKFQAALSVAGPKPVTLANIRLLPHWDTAAILLDDETHVVEPHQSFVREYLADIDRVHLETSLPDSLVFAAEIIYGTNSLAVSTSISTLATSELSIEFIPNFFIVPPSARLEVDKVVSSLNWKVVISKPTAMFGEAQLNLETPPGLFAGAYRQKWQLETGRVRETISIPFSISNLFELGIHKQTITVSIDNRQVAVDTGIIRVAACNIPDTVRVGLMPDSSGLLEDILRQSGANYRPLTDRTLETGDLEAYDVIIIGSGALRAYPSFRKIRGRLENYLRYGGSVVLFSQPDDWPHDVLPVSFVPTSESLTKNGIVNRIPEARILNQPHVINSADLLASFAGLQQVRLASVAPAEKVYVSASGAALLSVSRLGDGQIIFCGLPLLEMISRLELEAIHLFANVLNY